MSKSDDTSWTLEKFYAEFSEPVGKLVIVWSMLENSLTLYLQILFKLDAIQTSAFVHPLDTRTMTETLRAFFKFNKPYRDEKLTKEVLDVLADIDELRLERNKIIHGFYGYNDDGNPQLQIVNASQRFGTPAFPITPDYIYSLAKRIEDRAIYVFEAYEEAQKLGILNHSKPNRDYTSLS